MSSVTDELAERSGKSPPTALGHFLRGVFAAFESEQLTYAVLRNADGLPDHTNNDVDLLVAPASVESASRCILVQAQQHGWETVATLKKFEYQCHWLVQGPGANREFLQVDLLSMLHFRGFAFAEAATGLAGRTFHRGGFYVVSPGFESAFTVAKELLAKGNLKEGARRLAQEQALTDKGSFLAAFCARVPRALRERLWQATQAGDWAALAGLGSELRRAVTRRRLREIPRYLRHAWITGRHYLGPPLSCFVVFIGPDGSGKTTVAQMVGERLINRPFKIVQQGKSVFGVLPPLQAYTTFLRRLCGKKSTAKPQVAPGTYHSGMIQPNSLPASLVYVAYYSVDLWIGRALLRRWRGQCGLILFDRYYYDYYYQIGNRKAPAWCLRLFELLVPAPDLIVHLEQDAEEIFRRKPELSAGEIRFQQQTVQRLLDSRPQARIVNARYGLEATVQQVCELILDHLVQRSSAVVSRQ